MVEALIHCLQRNLLPSRGTVARLAGLRETAMVRIAVAVRALIKLDPGVLRFAIGSIGVTLCALHLRVKSGERIASLGVVELADVDRFPVLKVVTRLAILSQAALVLILVTCSTCGGKAQIGAVQIFDLDSAAFLRRNMRWIVALVAG